MVLTCLCQISIKAVSSHKYKIENTLKWIMKILQFLASSFKAQRAQGKTEATIEAEGHEEGSWPRVSYKMKYQKNLLLETYEDCTILFWCVLYFKYFFKCVTMGPKLNSFLKLHLNFWYAPSISWEILKLPYFYLSKWRRNISWNQKKIEKSKVN